VSNVLDLEVFSKSLGTTIAENIVDNVKAKGGDWGDIFLKPEIIKILSELAKQVLDGIFSIFRDGEAVSFEQFLHNVSQISKPDFIKNLVQEAMKTGVDRLIDASQDQIEILQNGLEMALLNTVNKIEFDVKVRMIPKVENT